MPTALDALDINIGTTPEGVDLHGYVRVLRRAMQAPRRQMTLKKRIRQLEADAATGYTTVIKGRTGGGGDALARL